MTRLDEGLKAHDLDYVIMPIVSVDEYESKIDDRKAIVVGFFVTDKDPANMLSSFIEKGNIDILDTDVSPAPTEDGFYLVFVEMTRDEGFVDKLMLLIESLENLTNVEEWQFSPYHSKQDENYDLTADNLRDRINLDPDSIEIKDEDEDEDGGQTESIQAFFKDALFESMMLEDDVISIRDRSNVRSFRLVETGDETPSIPIVISQIGDPMLSECNRLQSMLGQSFEVYLTENAILVTGQSGYVMLSPI